MAVPVGEALSSGEITVPADDLLLVRVYEETDANVTGVTLGTTPLTAVQGVQSLNGGTINAYAYYLLPSAAQTNQTVTITFSAQAGTVWASYEYYSGVNQTAPLDVPVAAGAEALGATTSFTITAQTQNADSLISDGMLDTTDIFLAEGTQTEIFSTGSFLGDWVSETASGSYTLWYGCDNTATTEVYYYPIEIRAACP